MSGHDNWMRYHPETCPECREALERPRMKAMTEALLRVGECMGEWRREHEAWKQANPDGVARADAVVMQMLSKARFAPGTEVTLPSGQYVDGSEIGEVLHEEER